MKKVILLPIFGLVLLVPQVWAVCNITSGGSTKCCMYNNDPNNCYGINGPDDKNGGVLQTDATCTASSGTVVLECVAATGLEYCRWSDGNCFLLSENDRENCKANGSLYTDVPPTGIGNGKKCEGGQWTGGRDPNTVKLGCCNWDGKGCFPVYDDTKWGSCSAQYKYNDCIGDEAGTCPVQGGTSSSSGTQGGGSSSSGTQIGGSSSSGTQGGSSSSSGGVTTYTYCIVNTMCLSGPFTLNECTANIRGVPSNDCPIGNLVTGTPSSSSNSGGENSGSEKTFNNCIVNATCLSGPFTLSQCTSMNGLPSNGCPDISTPIVLSRKVYNNALSTMQNAVNLQITSNAAVQVFDLKGNAVRSLKLGAGSYVVPLSGLPKGLYIVKASNASWKQTVKATVR